MGDQVQYRPMAARRPRERPKGINYVAELLELVALIVLFGVGYGLVQSLFGSFYLQSFLMFTLPELLFSLALLELTFKLKSGSRKAYVITLVLFAIAIDVSVPFLFEGNLYSLIIVCLGAAVLIYLTDRDIRGYYFPIPDPVPVEQPHPR